MMNKKNNRKQQEQIKNNDYLNFIRRNQQIVREFKIISDIQKKSSSIQNMIMQYKDSKGTHEQKRYRDPPSFGYESYKSDAPIQRKQLSISLKYVQDPNYQQIDPPIAPRKPKTDDFLSKLIEKQAKIQIKTRNLSIPTHFQSLKDRNEFGPETKSKVKFPKLALTNKAKYDEDISSTQSLSIQRQILSPVNRRNSSKTNISESDQVSSKKKYVPIQLDNRKSTDRQSPQKCKVKSMKFSDMPKAKLNGKLIRTYYDYENLMQLKQKVSDLIPTFKPLQPRKRQKIQILQMQKYQGQLEQYLETNRIENPINQLKKSEEHMSRKRKINITTKKYRDISERLSKNTEQEQRELTLDKKSEQQQYYIPRSQSKKSSVKHSSSSPLKKNKQSRKQLIFPPKNQEQTVYQNKIHSYRQFLFLVNFAHRIFDPLILVDNPDAMKNQYKYRFYLGKGNNSLLVKSLLKRRFWWMQTDSVQEANFVWTQLKINNYYQFQRKTILQNKFDKLDEDHPYKSPKPKKAKSQNIQNKKSENKTQGGILRGQLPQKQQKIFTKADLLHYEQMLKKPQKIESLKKFQNRLKYLPENFLQKRQYESYDDEPKKLPHMTERVHNHFIYNFQIGNKKAMFYHLRHYYQLIDRNPYEVIPLTFHIKNGVNDPQYIKFVKQFKRLKQQLIKAQKSNTSTKKLSKNIWIVKPGEVSNRGNGITVIDEMYQINSILKNKNNKHANGQEKTYIVQKYIEKPMLYKNRKFDIRHYMLISGLHGRKRAYWFSEGYIRTSSYEYNLEDVGDVMIHLTNDAIQQHCNLYGKYQQGNKLSYAEFQRYLDGTYPQKKYSFIDTIYPKMRQIATDAIKATYLWMDPESLSHNFQIFGLDFMIDAQFNVWLIEINTNPCLELSSNLLSRLIPTMVEHSFRLCLDPIFPPPSHYQNTIKYLAPDTPLERLQYQLIFDENRDGKQVQQILLKAGRADCGQIQEQDEVYQNDGKQIDIGGDLE